MSATLAPSTGPVTATPAPDARAREEAGVRRAVSPADAEMHRWMVLLGIPFAFAASFFAIAIGTSAHWVLGLSLVLGPMLFMFATIYLCISSDSNGEVPSPAA
jgi:hypothetical protein